MADQQPMHFLVNVPGLINDTTQAGSNAQALAYSVMKAFQTRNEFRWKGKIYAGEIGQKALISDLLNDPGLMEWVQQMPGMESMPLEVPLTPQAPDNGNMAGTAQPAQPQQAAASKDNGFEAIICKAEQEGIDPALVDGVVKEATKALSLSHTEQDALYASLQTIATTPKHPNQMAKHPKMEVVAARYAWKTAVRKAKSIPHSTKESDFHKNEGKWLFKKGDRDQWAGPLQDNYSSLDEFQRWDEIYNLSQRLGYDSAEAAWQANPMIQGSTNPSDFRTLDLPGYPSAGKEAEGSADNPNCDGNGPHSPGEVRLMPLGGGSNAILCHNCWQKELDYRAMMNRNFSLETPPEMKHDLPKWEDAQAYADGLGAESSAEATGSWKTLDEASQALYHKSYADLPDDGEEQDHVVHEFESQKGEQTKESMTLPVSPEFSRWLAEVAKSNNLSVSDVVRMWDEYEKKSDAYGQSAVQEEFLAQNGLSLGEKQTAASAFDNPQNPANLRWGSLDEASRKEHLQRAGLPTSLWRQELDEIYTPYAKRLAEVLGSSDVEQVEAADDLSEDQALADELEAEGPAPEDYTITPGGRLDSMLEVGQIEGGFLGEFDSMEEAEAAIRFNMEKDRFWPNVWLVSDHGNWELLNLGEEKKSKADLDYTQNFAAREWNSAPDDVLRAQWARAAGIDFDALRKTSPPGIPWADIPSELRYRLAKVISGEWSMNSPEMQSESARSARCPECQHEGHPVEVFSHLMKVHDWQRQEAEDWAADLAELSPREGDSSSQPDFVEYKSPLSKHTGPWECDECHANLATDGDVRDHKLETGHSSYKSKEKQTRGDAMAQEFLVMVYYESTLNQALDQKLEDLAARYSGESSGSGFGFGKRDLTFSFRDENKAVKFRDKAESIHGVSARIEFPLE